MGALDISPKQVDFLIGKVFGSTGRDIANIADLGLSVAFDEKLGAKWGLPWFHRLRTRFVQDATKPTSFTRQGIEYSKMAEEYNKTHASLNFIKKGGDPKKIQEFVAKNMEILKRGNFIKAFEKNLKEAWQKRRIILMSPKLTDDQREEYLNKLQEKINSYHRIAYGYLR